MDLNCDTFIKQEIPNIEEELTNSTPLIELNIPVKNEPILDDSLPSVVIKNEPLTDETFIEEDVTIKNENSLQAGTEDKFIIYELETPSTITQKLPALIQQSHIQMLNKISPQASDNQISNVAQTEQTLVGKNPLLLPNQSNMTKSNVAVSPPILLNSQLRKRRKGILPKNPIDKRTRYNIEGTTPATLDANSIIANSLNSTENSNVLLKTGSKKIINHLIKHKRYQRKQDYTLREPSKISRNLDDKVTIGPQSSICSNQSQTTENAQTGLKLIASFPATMTQLLTSQKNSLNLTKQSAVPLIAPELRVKCLCSLTDDTTIDNTDLKAFFNRMFEETRRLNKTQQRNVKMLLLKAISDAEELMEQGKCCGF